MGICKYNYHIIAATTTTTMAGYTTLKVTNI